jgi:paraquat-inducible protein B
MEPISIVLIVLGIALLIGSCFFGKDELKEPEYDELLNRLAKRELSAEETERIRQTVDQIISDKTEEMIIKTDDYLSQVANEKIMSVDEFSKQILERLDKNNSDVMFLYNMVTETKEELKSEIANAKKVKEALSKVVEKKSEEAATAVAKKQESTTKTNVTSKAEPIKRPTVKKEPKEQKPDEIAELLAATMTHDSSEVDGDMPKERILELYKNGKSIRDISRELGMGQGEVKLVVDLYGL